MFYIISHKKIIYFCLISLLTGAGLPRPPYAKSLDSLEDGPKSHNTKSTDDIYQNYSQRDDLDTKGFSGNIIEDNQLAKDKGPGGSKMSTLKNDAECSGLPKGWRASEYPINKESKRISDMFKGCLESNMSTRVGFDKPLDIPTTENDYTPVASKIGASPPLPPNYKLVFMDDFNGNSLDKSKWSHEINCWGGGNDEQQCYVDHPDVLSVQDGKLIMRAINVPGGYQLGPNDKCNADPATIADGACTKRLPTKSARIRTHNPANRGAGSWKYGRFEMKAKLPHGNYLWPAFWMLPTDYKYGTWAASGEFDIMESRGQNPDEVGSTLHYGSSWPKNVYSNKMYFRPGLSNDFNVYGLDWDEKAIRFYVNDNYIYQVETVRDWTSPAAKGSSPYTIPGQPWDQDFHLILNLAVGGNFFPGGKFDPANDPKTWGQEFIIDWIKVFQPEKTVLGKPSNQTSLDIDDKKKDLPKSYHRY